MWCLLWLAGGVGWGLGALRGGFRGRTATQGSAFGGPGGGRPARAGQVMAQLVPLWCRPRLVSRVRLTAAARSVSQWRFFRVPM